MNSVVIARQFLKKHEGFRSKVYLCTSGKKTVGYGRNLDDKGITEDEADYLLDNDIAECLKDLSGFLWCWNSLNEYQQAALIDFRFNLGHSGFRQFKKAIAALEAGDFKEAGAQIMNSRYASQVGKRAKDIVDALVTKGEPL